ncbi:TetR/AcrR family transcriptional regulator [Nonomuraea sp. NPDC059023]|uniref:TetR/AcrR family transcriptional regulator n=1 Tax=Nonomuraea sp. NPDC059023 TaxID=3346706 RepID=UPI0036A60701
MKVLDRDGFEAMTMTAVAGELGARQMSIYNHVRGKDDLFAAVYEHMLAMVPAPETGGVAEPVALYRDLWRVFRAHPWLVQVGASVRQGIYRAITSCGKVIWGHNGGIFGYGTDMMSTLDGKHRAVLSVAIGTVSFGSAKHGELRQARTGRASRSCAPTRPHLATPTPTTATSSATAPPNPCSGHSSATSPPARSGPPGHGSSPPRSATPPPR